MSLILILLKPDEQIQFPQRQAISRRFKGGVCEIRCHENTEIVQDEELEDFTKRLSRNQNLLHIILVGFAEDELISPKTLLLLGSQRIGEVLRLDPFAEGSCFIPHRPLKHKRSQGLFVFPGPIVPISMGSHQRAFQMITTLLAEGKYVDLLVTAGNHATILHAQNLLYQISPAIHFYRNNKPKLSISMARRRKIESFVRILRKMKAPAPALFSERLWQSGTYSGRKLLKRLLGEKSYDFVMVNYAWLDRITEHVGETERKKTTWICDTHDVQFVRNDSDNKNEWRFMRDPIKERDIELEVLNKYDAVLAISESDKEALNDAIDPSKVLGVPTGFNYAINQPREPNPNKPIFGFIGRNMTANEKSLDILLNQWWPHISKRWPSAELRIAGSICSCQILTPHFKASSQIKRDGFVSDLSSWYRSIDIMANPVVVQGGVNFKAIEAVMAGRLLLTNDLGLKCLGNPDLGLSVNNGSELVEKLEIALADTSRYLEERKNTQSLASEIYNDSVAARDLLAFLNKSASRETEKKTVTKYLIQCGDSFENRTRILPLARGLADKGLHPVVLVYNREFVAPFLAAGVDAIALYDFTPSASEIAAFPNSSLNDHYDGLSIEDITYLAQQQAPEKFTGERLGRTMKDVGKSVLRVCAVVDFVKPDCLIVWNGHTGYTANVLRTLAKKLELPSFFLERSIFPDGLYIDPEGTNGGSQLSRVTKDQLMASDQGQGSRMVRDRLKSIPEEEILELRNSGPWSGAKAIVFIPLQVQNDTNIKLFSPELDTMTQLIASAYRAFHGHGVAFIVRPHPEEVGTKTLMNHDNRPERVPKNFDLSKVQDTYVDSSGSLDTWLCAADLVVTINSTVGLEAILRGTPTYVIGSGIYSGKSLSTILKVDLPAAQKFWNLLLSSYTCLPENPLPACMGLAEYRNMNEPKRAFFNPSEIDPWKLDGFWDIQKEKIHESISENQEKLTIFFPGLSDSKINLDYRNHSARTNTDWIIKRCREQFDIAHNTSITISKEIPTDGSFITVVNDRQDNIPVESLLAVDPYMWPVLE